MILVDSLSCVDTPKYGNGNEELENTNQRLEHDDKNGYQAQDSMWGDEVRVRTLVDLNDGEAG